MELIHRGFRVTANGFSTHYTWDNKSKVYRCDDDPTYCYEEIPKSGRMWVQVDEEIIPR